MKLLIAGNDRAVDLGLKIRSAAASRRCGCAPREVASDVNALRLLTLSSEGEYLREFIRLLRAFDTLDFDIPRRAGIMGRTMAGFKKLLWKLMRFQCERIAFQQNLINRMFTTAIENEAGLRERELGELRRRVEELEARG